MGNWKVIKYLQGNTGARDGSLEDEEYDNYGDEDYDHEDDQDYNNDDENYGRGLLDDDYEWWWLRDILFPFGIGGWAKKCAVLQTLVDRSLSCYVLQTIGSGYLQYLYCRLLLHCYWIWMNYAISKFCLQFLSKKSSVHRMLMECSLYATCVLFGQFGHMSFMYQSSEI